MELKPPVMVRFIRPLSLSALFLLVVLPLLIYIVRAAASGDLSPIVMLGPMAALMTLALWLRVSWLWRAARWRLTANDEGITLTGSSEATFIRWQQISTCREEASPLERDQGSWVTLRDEGDNVLLRWERSCVRPLHSLAARVGPLHHLRATQDRPEPGAAKVAG